MLSECLDIASPQCACGQTFMSLAACRLYDARADPETFSAVAMVTAVFISHYGSDLELHWNNALMGVKDE
jgi:hypothetical protein